MKNETKKVFRSFALPVSAFDYLKDFMRGYRSKYGIDLNNNQAITIIFGEHKAANVASGGRGDVFRI